VLETARRIAGVAGRFKEIAGCAITLVRPELLGQLGQHGDVAALPAFGLGDQDHLLVEEQLLRLDVGKLRIFCDGLMPIMETLNGSASAR
jgi:hypothetical protein